MDSARWKKLFYFSLAVVMAVLLIWFGSKFLFWPNQKLDSIELFIAGVLSIIGALCLISTPKNWRPALILAIIGFYFFARAANVIELPWLARLIGFASWLAALLLVYIAWPSHQQRSSKKEPDANLKS